MATEIGKSCLKSRRFETKLYKPIFSSKTHPERINYRFIWIFVVNINSLITYRLVIFLATHTLCETQLLTNTMFNYEDENLYNILVKVSDHAGLSHVAAFNVTIGDRNDAPRNVTVEGEVMVFVKENLLDTMIGELETTDEDLTQTFRYILLKFTIFMLSVRRTQRCFNVYTTNTTLGRHRMNVEH